MGCHDSKNRIQVCKNTVGKKILTDFAESKQYKYNRTVMRKRGHMRKTEAMINEIEKVIIGKREVIEQVLMNLMENAVLHAEGATEIELRIRREGDLAQFSVLDNGAGIEPAVLPKLFEEMFPHAGELRGDGRRSMGIGLSVCMSIVRAHGGTMKAKNRATGGACVSFVLPMGEE